MSTILKALRRLEEDRTDAPDAKTGVGRRIAATASRGTSGGRIAGIGVAGLALVAVFVWAFGPWRGARETAPEGVEARASGTAAPAPMRVDEPPPRVPARPSPPEPVRVAEALPSPVTRAEPTERAPVPVPPAEAAARLAQPAPQLSPTPAREAPRVVPPPSQPAPAGVRPATEPAPPLELEASVPKLPPPPAPGTELGSGPPGTRPAAARVARRAPPPARPPAVRPAARASLPEVAIASTTWHPDAAKREAVVRVTGREGPLRLREGDAVGGLVVQEIEPAAVVFVRAGVEIRKPVGAAR